MLALILRVNTLSKSCCSVRLHQIFAIAVGDEIRLLAASNPSFLRLHRQRFDGRHTARSSLVRRRPLASSGPQGRGSTTHHHPAATGAVIALPISVGDALPPRSRVRGPSTSTFSSTASMASCAAQPAGPTLVDEIEHQRAQPDHRHRVGDDLVVDVGRRALHRLEERGRYARVQASRRQENLRRLRQQAPCRP